MRHVLVVLLVLAAGVLPLHAQDAAPTPERVRQALLQGEFAWTDSTETAQPTLRKERLWWSLGGLAAADVVTMAALNELWYGDEERVGWHWYCQSDRFQGIAQCQTGRRWLDDYYTYVQQDKLGHVFVSYQLARLGGAYGRWTGMSRRRAGLFGGVLSFAFQAQIELFDGFSADYGASRSDFLANTLGAGLGGAKAAFPERTRAFTLKYSYHRSQYYDEAVSDNAVASYLGNVLKDYDGISYWAVVRPHDLLPEDNWWPRWLGLGLGYTADGIAHAVSTQEERRFPVGIDKVHRRVFLLGPDIDVLEHLDLPQPWQSIADALSFIRIPAPAVETSSEGVRWYWLYY